MITCQDYIFQLRKSFEISALYTWISLKDKVMSGKTPCHNCSVDGDLALVHCEIYCADFSYVRSLAEAIDWSWIGILPFAFLCWQQCLNISKSKSNMLPVQQPSFLDFTVTLPLRIQLPKSDVFAANLCDVGINRNRELNHGRQVSLLNNSLSNISRLDSCSIDWCLMNLSCYV